MKLGVSISLALALALCACRNEEKRRENVALDLEALMGDYCLKRWLSPAQKKRVMEKARAGQIEEEAVDAYMAALRKEVDRGQKAKLSNTTFCRGQRNLFRKHVLR